MNPCMEPELEDETGNINLGITYLTETSVKHPTQCLNTMY